METVTILPAEWVGKAAHDKEGILTIGTGDNIVSFTFKLKAQCLDGGKTNV
jgi:hypothetical protein